MAGIRRLTREAPDFESEFSRLFYLYAPVVRFIFHSGTILNGHEFPGVPDVTQEEILMDRAREKGFLKRNTISDA